MTEDLSLFFEDFAVTATVKNASNVTVGTASVIFDKVSDLAGLFEVEVMPTQPMALGLTSDLSAVRDGWKLVIDGVTYRISGTPRQVGDGAFTALELKPTS